MLFVKQLTRDLFRYVDITYLLKFLLLFGALYYVNMAFLSIVSPYGGYYSSFLDHYLNYADWIRASVLHAARFIGGVFGFETYLQDSYTLRVNDGAYVIMGDACLGLGVLSFWMAFILADSTAWKKRLLWCAAGIALIWFINCWRVFLLLIALENRWTTITSMDHHTTFNIAAYLLIFSLIYFYQKKENPDTKRVSGASA